MNWKERLPNATKSFWKRNQHLVPMAPELRAEKPKRNERGQGEDQGVEKVQVGDSFRITFTVYRRRLLDGHDNARMSLKPVVDVIAKSLGFKDDADPKLEWCYHQIKSRTVGTHILIEQLTP